MKVLYISSRLNVPDGSSVHGRAFVSSVQQLGHEIVTYPEILPLAERNTEQVANNKGILRFIKKFRPKTILFHLKKSHYFVAVVIEFVEGAMVSIKDFFKLRKIVKKSNPDIIVFRKYFFNFAVIWISRRYQLPCIAEVNSIKQVESKLQKNKASGSSFSHWAEKYPLLNSSHVFCVSTAIKNNLDTFLDPDKVSVVPNGVDVNVFDREQYDPDNIKKSLGLEGKTILGYAGSYQAWHDVPQSIDVISKLKDINPSFHLLLIGNGQGYSAIKQMVKERQLEEYVTQIDYVLHAEMPKYLAAFDVALMTYPIFEGFYFSPLKMYEYMAMSIPVVSTDIGQIRDVIVDNVTGILVQKPDTANFVAAVLSITDEQNRLLEMGRESRLAAVEKHSWLVNASQVMELCSKTLNYVQ